MESLFKYQLLLKGYIVLNESKTENRAHISKFAAALKSFESLGYKIEGDYFNLLKLDEDALTIFYNSNFEIMKAAKGDNVNHIIFYPNFPNIDDISDDELYVRALLHYQTANDNSYGFMNQDLAINENEKPSIKRKDYEAIKLVSEAEAIKILSEYMNAYFEQKNAISYSYFELIRLFSVTYPDLLSPSDIPFKENIAYYFKILTRFNDNKLGDILNMNNLRFVKTATDLLRIYSVISGGSALLEGHISFISLDRKVRRLFLSILDDICQNNPYAIDDFARNEFYYKRAFEKLHVGEYKKKFPYIYQVALDFRSGNYLTYYSNLEMNKNNQDELIRLLSMRPGEFCRRLDYILRNKNFDVNKTLSAFKNVASQVSTNVLLGLWEFYKNRNLYSTRLFHIKKLMDVFKEIDDEREVLNEDIVNEVLRIIECTLRNIYSNYEQFGTVYLDDSLKNYVVPTNSRNSSLSNHALSFGTRIKLDESNDSFIRLFTHWKNMANGERVDIDLSVEFVNDEFNKMFSVAWHSLGNGKKFDTYHSGDITTAPNGASEFIDINYKKARKFARYAIVSNSVYTGQSYCDIPECFSGVAFMSETDKNSIIHNPSLVKNKYDLCQKGVNQIIAFAIDLETMEMIWMDTPLQYAYNRVVACENYGVIAALKKALMTKMNLYDFFNLHDGHMTIVDNKDEAEVIISDSNDATINAYDLEIISSRWI